MAAVARAVFGYCFLILIVRIAGRRPGKQMTPFEFVSIFFMGGVTLTSMVGDDRSFTNALIQIISIAFTHFVLTWLKMKSPAFGRIVDGTPLVLIKKGEWVTEVARGMRVHDDDVMATARAKGLQSLDEIDYAILERNGQISIIERNRG